jgi:hypothetical protein
VAERSIGVGPKLLLLLLVGHGVGGMAAWGITQGTGVALALLDPEG